MTDFTRREIKNKFFGLICEKSFDKITVKELVDACGISRNTFYYHYHDIFEVLEDICETEIMTPLEEEKNFASLVEIFTAAASFAYKNKKAMLHIHQSSRRQYFEQYLMNAFEKIIGDYVRQQAEGLDVDEGDILLLVAFYKHGLVGILREWLDRGMNDEESAILERMAFMLEGNIRSSLMKISK